MLRFVERRRARRALRRPLAARSGARCTAAAPSCSRRATRAGSSACCPSSSTTSPRATCPRRRSSTACGWPQASLDAFSAEEAARSAKTRSRVPRRGVGGRPRRSRARRGCSWPAPTAWRATSRARCGRRRRRSGSSSRRSRPRRAVGALLLAAETAWQARRTEEAGRWVEKGLAAARAAGRDREPAAAAVARGDRSPTCAASTSGPTRYLRGGGRGSRPAARGAADEEMPRGGRLVVALANPVSAVEPADDRDQRGGRGRAPTSSRRSLATDAAGQPRARACARSGRSLDGGRGVPCCTLRPRRALLRRAPADRAATSRLLRGVDPAARRASMPPAFAAIRGVRRVPRRDDADEVAGIVVHGRRTSWRSGSREPLPIYPALLTEASTGDRAPAGRRREPSAAGHRAVPASPRSEPDRVVLERNPRVLAGRAGRRSTRSSSGRPRDARRHRRGASARARSTSPATCCPRTSRRSCATRASAAGSSRPPRRTPTSCSSTRATGPPRANPARAPGPGGGRAHAGPRLADARPLRRAGRRA